MGSPLSLIIAHSSWRILRKNNRTSDTQASMLFHVCRWHFRHLGSWPRKTDRISEPPHWTTLQDTVYNGKEEEEGHLSFLDFDIYRKTDSLLGHKVYWKPTHTNLYLHQNLHHHPANKQSVLTSLIHRAKALCDQDSLTQELLFLITVFKENGYSPQHIWWAMEPATWTTKTNDKRTCTAYIPYTQTTDGWLSSMLAKHNIRSSPYHLEKYSATFHQLRMHWD